MKAQISMAAIISLVIGFIVLAAVFAPTISGQIAGFTNVDPNAQSLMMLIVPAMFGMIIIAAFLWATGRRPPGHWGE